MTEKQAIEKVLDLARSEIGYREKRSKYQLDDKTANAGSGNWTKYARDLDAVTNFYNGTKNGYSWCDIFVDWLFYQCFGATIAMKILCQPYNSAGAGCMYSAQYYKNAGRWTHDPQPGDQIFFFDNAGQINHTGIVEEINAGTVITIEGNTSDSVQRRTYELYSGYIAGYGHPAWQYATATTPTPAQTVININITNNINILRYGSKGEAVQQLQEKLLKLGYNLGSDGADGDFGNMTKNAVIQFQRANGLKADGEVGPATTAAIDKKLQSNDISTSSKTYTVKRGDSLWSIAQRYLGSGARYTEIKKLNNLKSNLLKEGQTLILP